MLRFDRIASLFLSGAITFTAGSFMQAESRAKGDTSSSQSQPDSVSEKAELGELEQKLFGESYQSEDDVSRLNRLESYVMGEPQSGSVHDRVTFLNNTIAANEITADDASGKTAEDKAAAPQPASFEAQTKSSESASGPQPASYPTFDYGSYPRVTELEQQLLGKTFASDALPDRLARLETKVFGKPSTTPDLSLRTDALDAYAQRHDLYGERKTIANHVNEPAPLATMDSAPPPENPFANSGEVTNPEDRVATMERAVFNHVYESRKLPERVAKLEKKLVPYEHNDEAKPIETRINHLWTILSVANTMKSSPVIASNRDNLIASNQGIPQTPSATNSNGQPVKHSWLHEVARAIGSASQPAGSDPLMSGYPGTGGVAGPGVWFP